jgi:hypothetical protein
MKPRMELVMISLRAALLSSYSEFAALRDEIDVWHTQRQPFYRKDNRDSTYYLGQIADGLRSVSFPDFSFLAIEVQDKMICANLRIDSVSRETSTHYRCSASRDSSCGCEPSLPRRRSH